MCGAFTCLGRSFPGCRLNSQHAHRQSCAGTLSSQLTLAPGPSSQAGPTAGGRPSTCVCPLTACYACMALMSCVLDQPSDVGAIQCQSPSETVQPDAQGRAWAPHLCQPLSCAAAANTSTRRMPLTARVLAQGLRGAARLGAVGLRACRWRDPPAPAASGDCSCPQVPVRPRRDPQRRRPPPQRCH